MTSDATMTQQDKAAAFRALHRKGAPLVLYNIWDAGSARAVAGVGAAALATGSWSVAAAQGFDDGETLPLEMLESIVRRIATVVPLPLSVDAEGGYAVPPEGVAATIRRLIEAGAIGVNLEDQVVGGTGLHAVTVQVERLAAARRAADALGVPAFINARTDLFLKERDATRHASLIAPAKERAAAYAEAGADGFFVPGLTDVTLIAALCEAIPLPVNVMAVASGPDRHALTGAGVARISYGPLPYRRMMAALAAAASLPPE